MAKNDSSSFLSKKKPIADETQNERVLDDEVLPAVSRAPTDFDDGIVTKPKAEVTMDPRRLAADEIFRTREYEGEPLRMGQVLRRVREALELDLGDISTSSRLRKDFLMSIERMEVNTLPKGYLSVYLRAYARELGLPAEDVIKQYTHECGAVDEVKLAAPAPKLGEIEREKPRWPLYAAAAGVLVVLGATGIGLAQLMRKAPQNEGTPVVVAAVNGARESLFEEKPSRPLPSDFALELVAVRQAWVEVRGADGTIFRSREMAAGETFFPRLHAGWTVSAEDGGAFAWRAGSFEAGPLGADGAQVFSVSIDRELERVASLAEEAKRAEQAAAVAVATDATR
jgi:hypothetical protein